MVKGRRWSDKEVAVWAKLYLKKGENFISLEKKQVAPHATICWCFNNRLYNIDWSLYKKVMEKIYINSRPSLRNKKEGK